jgi:hypothetical protein
MDQSLVSLLFKVLPWIFPAATMAMTYAVYRKHRRWVEAPKSQVEALIVRFEVDRDTENNSTSYFPVYRFQTTQGKTIEARDITSSYIVPKVGSRTLIFYDQTDPNQVSLRATGMPSWGWIVVALANAAFLAFAWMIASSVN